MEIGADELRCPTCGEVIAHEEIEADRKWVSCSACHGILDLKDMGLAAPLTDSANEDAPWNIRVDESVDRLTIYRREGARYLVSLILVVIFFGYFSTTMLMNSSAWANKQAMVSMVGTCTIISVVCAAKLALALVNRTTIIVGMDSLEIRHEPLPFPRGVSIPTREIASVMVKQISEKPEKMTRFELLLVTLTGETIRIGRSYATRTEPMYLRARIARFLELDSPHNITG